MTHAPTGAGLAGVTVSAGNVTATTAADGSYSLAGLALGNPVVLAFTGTGFSAQSCSLDALTAETAARVVNVPLLPVAFTETFDPTTARTSIVPGSTAQVQLPANALRTATGAVPVMSLDVDAVTGFGPEFTTFPKLTKNRVDTYFGNNFSRS